jgi:hypothetical protein
MPSTCCWREDADGTYDTACGCAFVLNAGSPAAHDMRFCCYCGSVLFEVRYHPAEEEDPS